MLVLPLRTVPVPMPAKFVPAIALALLWMQPAAGMPPLPQVSPGPTGEETRPAVLLSDLALQLVQNQAEEPALRLFDRAIAIAAKLPGEESMPTLAEIALRLAEAGQTERSLQVFQQAIDLTQREIAEPYRQELVLQTISVRLAEAQYIDRAVALAETLPSHLKRAETFNSMVTLLGNQGQWDRAEQLLQRALQEARGITGDYAYESNGSCANFKFEVLSRIAANLSRFSQLNSALAIAQNIRGCQSASGDSAEDYQAWAYLGILSHLTTLEQVTTTWKRTQSMPDVTEKMQVWAQIALKLIDLDEQPYALFVAQKLANLPLTPPNGYSWRLGTLSTRETALQAIATALSEQRQFTAAMQVIERMTPANSASADQPNDYLPRPLPRSVALQAVARQQLRAGLLSQAIQTAKRIPEGGDQSLTWIALIRDAQQADLPEQAAALRPFLVVPSEVNPLYNQQDLEEVTVALVTIGQTQQALQIVRSFPRQDQELPLAAIAQQLVTLGQFDPALTITKSLKMPGPRLQSWLTMVQQWIKSGQVDQALQAIRTEPALAEQRDPLLAAVVMQLGESNQWATAFQLVEEITSPELKATTMAAIAARRAKQP